MTEIPIREELRFSQAKESKKPVLITKRQQVLKH